MEVIIRHNYVYLKGANLGTGFSGLVADLTVDKCGRVKVYITSRLSFYTDLDHLLSEILAPMSEALEKKESNRILAKIEKRIRSVLDARMVKVILE